MRISRKDFLEELNRLRPAIATGGNVPGLSHLWFNGRAVRAYDGKLGIRVPRRSDFECGVPGKPLLGLLDGTSLEDIDLEPGKKTGLNVKIGKSQAVLATLPAEDAPWFFPSEVPKNSTAFELTEEILTAFSRVLVIKVPKPKRIEHFGVSIFLTASGFTFYVSDSFSLSQIVVSSKMLPKEATKIVLPRPFVEQVIEQCAAGDKMYILKDCFVAVGKNATIYSNLLDNEGLRDLPAMVTKIVSGDEPRAPIPKGLGAALNRACLLSAQDEEPKITLATEDKQLYLAGDYKLGNVTDELKLEKGLPNGELSVDLVRLNMLFGEVEEFAFSDDALLLYGKDDFMCLIGAVPARRN